MAGAGALALSFAAPALAGEPTLACPRHSPGFIEIPGTSTCIRIGGRVRSEYGASARRVSRHDIAGFGASGRVSVDSRTDTAYGPVRTFVRVKVRSDGR